jgi:hypothetical protein
LERIGRVEIVRHINEGFGHPGRPANERFAPGAVIRLVAEVIR